ncbi:MAG: acetyltransferase-like isoleucine patch superfamily enzyme [Colwellia sp.]
MKIIYIFLLFFRDIYRYLQHLNLRASWRAKGIFIAKNATISIDTYGEVNLGKGVVISDGALIVATTEKAKNKVAKLSVGENSVINEYANIRASGGEIYIGSNTMIAQGVSIIATNHNIHTNMLMIEDIWDQSKSDVFVGNNVWLGAHSVLLPGVKIGDGAVVAAGAVVNKDIGENEIWGGVPARYINTRIVDPKHNA